MEDRLVQYGVSPTRVGAANMSRLTLLDDIPYSQPSPGMEAAAQVAPAATGSPHLWLSALLVLGGLWFVTRNHISLGPLNIFMGAVTLIALIVLLKTFAAAVYVPGLSPVILAA